MEKYIPFARKYRPKFFKEVVGQEVPVRILKNAVKLNKISHAYMFFGPRGVGKTTVARILAKAVNCLNPSEGEPCGACENCSLIDRGIFPDLIEIDAASNRGIDDIRSLRESVNYTPMKGKFKIYILDEAHMLTKEAFNALLKTLEEPPPSTIFVLCTTEGDKIPPTIASRCQRLMFSRVKKEEIISYLEMISKREGIDFEREALEEIAIASDGCLRDAASLLDQASSFGENKVTKEGLESLLGILSMGKTREFLNLIIEGDIQRSLELLKDYYLRGINLIRLWENMTAEIRNIILSKTLEEPEKIIEHYDEFYQKFNDKPVEAFLYLESIFTRALAETRYKGTFDAFRIAIIKAIIVKEIVPLSKVIFGKAVMSVSSEEKSERDETIERLISELEAKKEGEKIIYEIEENIYKAFEDKLEEYKKKRGNVEFRIKEKDKKKGNKSTATLF